MATQPARRPAVRTLATLTGPRRIAAGDRLLERYDARVPAELLAAEAGLAPDAVPVLVEEAAIRRLDALEAAGVAIPPDGSHRDLELAAPVPSAGSVSDYVVEARG